MPLPAMLADQDWAKRLHRMDTGVPYGIALALAALLRLSRHTLDEVARHVRPLRRVSHPLVVLSRVRSNRARATAFARKISRNNRLTQIGYAPLTMD